MAERISKEEADRELGVTASAGESESDAELARQVAAAAEDPPLGGAEAIEDIVEEDWSDGAQDGEVSEAGNEPPEDDGSDDEPEARMDEELADLAAAVSAEDPREGVEFEEPKKKTVTRYIVLEELSVKMGSDEESSLVYRKVGEFDGAKALDLAANALSREHGKLVAVPVRNFKPRAPKEKPRPPVRTWE